MATSTTPQATGAAARSDDPRAEAAAGRRRAIELFRVRGIRIELDLTWLVVFALVLLSLSAGYFPRAFPGATRSAYWIAGLVATLGLFGSILLHELAHSLVAIRRGIEVRSIRLFLFGGVSELGAEASEPRTELLVAIVGPLTSFALAALFWALEAATQGSVAPLVTSVLGYLAWINVALGAFNLLPGYPLDGGRVLRAVLWRRKGSLTEATRLASGAGKGLAFGLLALGAIQLFSGALLGGLWLILIGMFLHSMAEAGYRSTLLRASLGGVTVADAMIREPVCVPPDLTLADLVEQYVIARGMRAFPVVEGGRVLGVIGIEAIRRVPEAQRRTATVREHLTPLDDASRIAPDRPLEEAIQRLQHGGAQRFLVFEGERLRGMLTPSAIVRFLEVQGVSEAVAA